jgi:hypothetical protein
MKDKVAILGHVEAGFNVTGPKGLELSLAVQVLISQGISYLTILKWN